MSGFEDILRRDIPLHVAAEYFSKVKTASVLSQAGREHIKEKNFAIPKGNGPGDTGKYPIHDEQHAKSALTYVEQHGTPAEKAQVYSAVAKKYPGLSRESSVPELKEKAEKQKAAAAETDAELAEKGRQRAVSSMAAEFEREKARRGERAGGLRGGTMGAIAGGLAGRNVGSKLLGHPGSGAGRLGAAAGLALGIAGGAKAGKAYGKERGIERDIRRHDKSLAKAAMQMKLKLAAMKLADEGAMGQEAPMASPTAGEMQPQNYLEAEQMGQQAQDANEMTYYKQQAQQARQEADMALQQAEQTAAATAEGQAQTEQLTQQALMAQDEATKQTQVAAQMRMALQAQRAALMQVVSEDPTEALAAQIGQGPAPAVTPGAEAAGAAAGAPPALGPEGMPPAEAGAGGPPSLEAGSAGAPPGAPPPGGPPSAPSPPPGAPMPPTASPPQAPQAKAAAMDPRLPWAAGGALLGAAGGYGLGKAAPGLRQQVQQLEGEQDGSFRSAMRLAASRGSLAGAELSEKHPVGGALIGAGKGAAAGAMLGPQIGQVAQDVGRGLAEGYRGAV